MIVIGGSDILYIDVDDTCVAWNPNKERLEREGVAFTCPESYVIVDGEAIYTPGWVDYIVPHKAHIEHIRQHKMRGHRVVVWSRGGAEWAEAVVRALHLEKYVDLCISKPKWVVDDEQPEEFMPKAKYLKEG